ncbi:hypothetical protein GCM10027568_34530 [Humibacter soli]
MQFFSALSEPDETEDPIWSAPPWLQPPSGEIPAPLAVSRILSRRPATAVSLRRVDVYSNGCSFRIQVDARRERDMDRDRWEDIIEAFEPHRRWNRERNSGLRLGVTLSDGRTATADRVWQMELGADENPEGPILRLNDRGGGGSSHEYRTGFQAWLWPLPPSGPVKLHYQWNALGIDESEVEFDAAAIVAAAAEVIPIWE